jgi:hypothetical protein
MRTAHRVAAAVLTTTALIGATSAAAHAQSTTIKDKASDVVSYTDDGPETGVVLGYADSLASGVDVRSMRAKHTKKSVSINVKFASLASGASVAVPIRVNGKVLPQYFLISTSKTKGEILNNKLKKKCSVPLTTKLGKSGSVNAVIKRSCLDEPKKIKVSVSASAFTIDGESFSAHEDLLSPTAVRTPTWTKWLKAS